MEIITRSFVSEYKFKFTDATDYWMLDQDLGWRQKPNLDTSYRFGGRDIKLKTNEDGFQTIGNPNAEIRILIIGKTAQFLRSDTVS